MNDGLILFLHCKRIKSVETEDSIGSVFRRRKVHFRAIEWGGGVGRRGLLLIAKRLRVTVEGSVNLVTVFFNFRGQTNSPVKQGKSSVIGV